MAATSAIMDMLSAVTTAADALLIQFAYGFAAPARAFHK